MPDFLHKDTAHDVEPIAPTGSASPEKRRVPGKPPKPPGKKKKPSKLFTEYYGAMFLFLVAAFIASGYVVLRPLIVEFRTVNTRIETTAQSLRDERDYLDSLNRSIAAAESIPSDTLERVNEALPRSVGIPKLLQTLAQLSEENGVRLTSIQFTAPKPSAAQPGQVVAALTPVPLDMNLAMSSPGYAATRRFLENLERNLRVLDVQQITVTGNEQSGELTYTVQLRTYTISAPATAVPVQAVSSQASASP